MNEDLLLACVQGFAILYGLAVGSFIAAAAVRIPEDRSLMVASSCPRCGHRLGVTDLVPVVSWLWLRGSCKHCGASISPLYPLVETLSALLAWLVARHLFGGIADLDAGHAVAWVMQYGFLALLLLAATVDVRHRIIPNETSVYAAPMGIAGHALLQWLGYDGFLAIGVTESVLGALVWGGFFGLMAWAWINVTGTLGLGWGDVKLALMIGAFLGFAPGGSTAILLGSVIGSVVGLIATAVLWRRPYLPFGPPLALGAAAVVLYGDLPVGQWVADWIVG